MFRRCSRKLIITRRKSWRATPSAAGIRAGSFRANQRVSATVGAAQNSSGNSAGGHFAGHSPIPRCAFTRSCSPTRPRAETISSRERKWSSRRCCSRPTSCFISKAARTTVRTNIESPADSPISYGTRCRTKSCSTPLKAAIWRARPESRNRPGVSSRTSAPEGRSTSFSVNGSGSTAYAAPCGISAFIPSSAPNWLTT